MQHNSGWFLPGTDPISHWKIVVQIVSSVHAPNSDLIPLKQIVGQTVMYNRTTNACEVESWHHTTLRMAPCHREHGVPYSGLFPWGAKFRYFRGSPGCHKIFHPRKLSTHCVALSTCSQIWTGDVLLWLFFATCSVLGPQNPPISMLAVPRVRAEEVNREV